MYTAFASVYDRLMNNVDYDKWAQHYAYLLSAGGVQRGRVCECACGTGALTVRLAKLGYQMTGVDLSQEMLSVAVEKARSAGVTVPFVKQDMCCLQLHRRQDAILCTCDGVNYLTKPERVRTFLSAAYQALKPGGALAFSFNLNTLRRKDVEQALAEAGLEVLTEGPYADFSHWVEQAVDRDVVVARKPSGK